MLKKGKSIIAVPDMYFNWAKAASKYGIELMKKEKFDVMFSMHEPPSSHICAMKIKEEFKDLPWVTYWSDPWLKDSTRENISPVRRKYEQSFERKVVNLSDRFIFVTKANRDDYVNSYNIPIEKIPFVQTDIVSKCNIVGKPVIVATQMMLSMTNNQEPTRAEVTDVAEAVLEGADCVMLSEETASGAYPVEAVMVMEKIILEAERHLNRKTGFNHLEKIVS